MADQDNQSLFRQESLERLSSPERLDELMTIVNLKTWLPLGTIGVLLGCGLIWSLTGRIPVTTTGRGTLVQDDTSANELVALLYFENRYRGQFRPGMPVVLMPETLLIYNESGVKAEVAKVMEPPPLTLGQVQQGNSTTDADPQQGSLEVLAQLSPMDHAMPPDTIVPGVEVEGRVTLEERAPITFIFPFLAQ
ncbi:MAG: hypothetical protein F6K42_03880 [Leptolyngbya sp. SIO1D8]|nr:hypothetical protein [Leptolyngbya sp. SIO1D8]